MVFSRNGTLWIADCRFSIANWKSTIGNWQLSYRPSFLSRDDGFLFCASFELARERRCKRQQKLPGLDITEKGNVTRESLLKFWRRENGFVEGDERFSATIVIGSLWFG